LSLSTRLDERPQMAPARVKLGASNARLWTRRLIHGAIAKAGVDAVPMSSIRHSIGRRARLLRALEVDVVIDVGANSGQFASELRGAGYAGKLISIEPIAEAYERLSARAARDPKWTTIRCALGESDGESTLNIAGNSASSSFLDMLPVHEEAAPGTAYVGHERVSVRRLESLLSEYVSTSSRPYLKVDVQGYELRVLRGAGPRLTALAAIQLELSLARLYAGAPMADEVDAFVSGSGYRLAGIEPGFADPLSGRLLQMDGIYVRSDLLAQLPGGAPT
jgi:FkbM family methyltransferase